MIWRKEAEGKNKELKSSDEEETGQCKVRHNHLYHIPDESSTDDSRLFGGIKHNELESIFNRESRNNEESELKWCR